MVEDREDVAAIVSLIYETVFAPKGWRGLVEKDPTGNQPAKPLGTASLQFIVPFLEQALAVAREQTHREPAEPIPTTLLDELPIPVCIVSRDLRLLSATKKAHELLQRESALSLIDGVIHAANRQIQFQLNEAIEFAIDSTQSRVLDCASESGAPQTFLAAPISWGAGQSAVALFLNIELGVFDRLSATLKDSYGLTSSEAEVTSHLAQGLSIEEIAEKKETSVNTVRTQVKSVFAKTGTKRQGELVSLVLNGPAVWLRLVKRFNPRPAVEPLDTKCILELNDGRTLSYGDYGPELGQPVFVFHHLMGSRNEKPAHDELLRQLNVRLIVPERPGVGQSTPMENRSLADWADDVRQLADDLHIHQFHVLGFSSGGPHGAACAALLENRVIKLALVASLMPSDELPEGASTNRTQRFLTGMARHWPSAIQKLFEIRYKRLLKDPDETQAAFERHGNSADVELIRDPVINRVRLENLRAASDVPVRVFASELVLLFRPWGFRISDLGIPVQIWHGRMDEYFPADHAEAMASIIPDCHAVFDDSWGHFFLYREWERILTELVR